MKRWWEDMDDAHVVVFLEYRALIKKLDLTAEQQKLFPNLLTTKLWSHCRNPNYFGELLIYGSFCLLPRHWVPCAWLACMVGIYWMYNMHLKEKSLARFGKEFEEYRARSGFFFPKLW